MHVSVAAMLLVVVFDTPPDTAYIQSRAARGHLALVPLLGSEIAASPSILRTVL